MHLALLWPRPLLRQASALEPGASSCGVCAAPMLSAGWGAEEAAPRPPLDHSSSYPAAAMSLAVSRVG